MARRLASAAVAVAFAGGAAPECLLDEVEPETMAKAQQVVEAQLGQLPAGEQAQHLAALLRLNSQEMRRLWREFNVLENAVQAEDAPEGDRERWHAEADSLAVRLAAHVFVGRVIREFGADRDAQLPAALDTDLRLFGGCTEAEIAMFDARVIVARATLAGENP